MSNRDPDVVTLTLRLPRALRDALAAAADAERRSLNRHVVWLLEHAVRPAPTARPKIR